MPNKIKFENLENSNLIIDCIYESSRKIDDISGEPLSKILNCGNQGGFRYRGSSQKLQYLILTSSLNEIDWPDYLDEENGKFIYYGDNRTPGHELHDTKKKGNLILKNIFEDLHLEHREKIPPIFIFTKSPQKRDVEFKGLAVPGALGLSQTEDLIAIWKSNQGERFQNYKSIFTILDIPVVNRKWINELINNNPLGDNCPKTWKNWVKRGIYKPLLAKKVKKHRSKEEQLSENQNEKNIINTIINYFNQKPTSFEKCAAEIAKLMDKNIIDYELTMPSRDGGRDAIGNYRIGLEENSINVEFALEAKLYSKNTPVTVKETSRLISRLRHRQFGILVTTSYLATQAYQEIIEDKHPIVVIASKDIVKILKNSGIDTAKKTKNWLTSSFPKD